MQVSKSRPSKNNFILQAFILRAVRKYSIILFKKQTIHNANNHKETIKEQIFN